MENNNNISMPRYEQVKQQILQIQISQNNENEENQQIQQNEEINNQINIDNDKINNFIKHLKLLGYNEEKIYEV